RSEKSQKFGVGGIQSVGVDRVGRDVQEIPWLKRHFLHICPYSHLSLDIEEHFGMALVKMLDDGTPLRSFSQNRDKLVVRVILGRQQRKELVGDNEPYSLASLQHIGTHTSRHLAAFSESGR